MAIFSQILVPENMNFMPDSKSISNAKRNFTRYYDYCEGIKVRKEPNPFFVSAWDGCNQFNCPACNKTTTSRSMGDAGASWSDFLTEAAKAVDATTHQVTTLCCSKTVFLPELDFTDTKGQKQATIARFKIVAQEIDNVINLRQLAQMEKNLGCRLIAITEIWG